MVDSARLGPVHPVTALRPADAATTALPRARPDAVKAHHATLPQLLTLVNTLADQGPPVDHAKIAQIRQAIALGSYRVDAQAIAGALLAYGRGGSR